MDMNIAPNLLQVVITVDSTPPGSAKQAYEKTATTKTASPFSRLLSYPLRAMNRLSGNAAGRTAARLGKNLGSDDAAGVKQMWKGLRQAGVQTPFSFRGLLGKPLGAGARVGDQLSTLINRGMDDQFMNAVNAGKVRRAGQVLSPEDYTKEIDRLRNLQVGTAAKPQTAAQALQAANPRWYDYALPVGAAGTGIAGAALGPNSESMANNRDENFLTQGMSNVGEWVENNLGLEGVGNWIQRHPYLSAGGGAMGSMLLLYLLMQMMGGRGR